MDDLQSDREVLRIWKREAEEREEVMEEGVKERSEGFTRLASRMEGAARGLTAQAAYRSWKRPGSEFSPRTFRWSTACRHLNLGLLTSRTVRG